MDDELLMRARTLTAAAQVIAKQLENTKITSSNTINEDDNDNNNNGTPSPDRLKQYNHHVQFKNPEEVEDKVYSWKGACIKGSSLITTFTDIRPYCPRGSTIILGGYPYIISMEGDNNANRITLSSDFIQDTNLDCMISISGNELEQAKKRNKKVIKKEMQPVSTSAIQSAVQDLDYITNMKAMRNDENNNKLIKKVKIKEVNHNRTQSAPSATGLFNAEFINQDDNDYSKRDVKDTIAYKMSSYEELYSRKDVVDSKVQREKAAKRVLSKMKEDKLKKMHEEKELIAKTDRIRAESELKAKLLREKTLKRLAEKKPTVESNPQVTTETEEEKQKQMAEKMANLELKAKRCRNETRKRLELIKAQDREKEKSRLLVIEKKLREISEAKKVSIPTRYAMGQNPREKSPGTDVISMKLRDEKYSIAAEYDVMYGSEEDDDVCKNLEIDREELHIDEIEEDDANLSVDSIEANTRNIRADSLASIEDNDHVGYLRNHVYGTNDNNDENNFSNGPSSPSSELTSSPSRQTDYSGLIKEKKKIKKYKRLPVIPLSVPYIPIPVQADLR